MQSFRLGVLGAGNISETHARAAVQIPGVEVVACWGRDATRTERMATSYGGVAYRDLEQFVAHPGMDAVVVGTPSGLHAEHARRAARHGLHVLVEKPLDIDTARVDAMIDECDQAGVTLGVIFQDRAAPDLAWLRRLIAGGGLGRPLTASAHVKWYRPPEYYATSRWRGTWALDGGGALMNQGTHTVDLLLWLFGNVGGVSAITRTMLHAIEVEDTALACLEFESGAIGTLEVTTAAYPGFPRRLELTGSEGTIVVEGDRVTSVNLRTPPSPPLPQHAGSTNPSASSPVVSDVRGHRRVIEDFVDAVRCGRPPLCDGRDGRRSVALVQAIYRAGRENTRVDVDDGPA
jgi:predicted dehydrogenase